MLATTPICIHCGKPIKAGRSDKKFCSLTCKDAYNNEIKIREHKEIRKIEGILKRNRRILKKLYHSQHKEKSITREMMIKSGFEFGFHTHTVITRSKGNEIIFSYDYGYREMKKDEFRIFSSFGKVQVKNGQIFEM